MEIELTREQRAFRDELRAYFAEMMRGDLARELATPEWSEGGQLASFACQHLHGGIGIDTDYPLHRYFKWAIQIEHELGSARHHLERLGRRIAERGLPAS